MRKKGVRRMTYVLLSAFLAGAVSGCGAPGSGQAQGENPAVEAVEGNGDTEGSGTISGSNEETGAGRQGMAAAVSGSAAENGSGGGDNSADGDTAGKNGAAAEDGSAAENGGNAPENGGNAPAGGTSASGAADTDVYTTAAMSSDGREAVTDFGLRLLQSCTEAQKAFPPQASMPSDVYARTGMGDNILVSPLSVISALAMTANGAAGETFKQMETTLGMPVSELSEWLSVYREALPEAEKYKLNMANGIWFTEDKRFTVNPDFLKTNEKLFGAGVYQAPFDDSTLREINGWVKENTDGMIDQILDEIPPDAVMYLVNALAFDAEWQEIYHDYQIREGEFTCEDGRVQKADMMYSTENAYMEDEHAKGFLKYYADGKYAFAALLPEEGMVLQDYLSTLDGAKLRGILDNPKRAQVDAAIPKYESEYSIEMSEVLQSMGMTDAFDFGAADFSGLGRSEAGNLYISRVLHKTYIAVDEKGTKAGAATAVEMKDECVAIEEPVVITVHLDRPFLYMIIDCEQNVPVFIGLVETAR